MWNALKCFHSRHLECFWQSAHHTKATEKQLVGASSSVHETVVSMNTDIAHTVLKAHEQLMNTEAKQNNGLGQCLGRHVFLCLTPHQNFLHAPSWPLSRYTYALPHNTPPPWKILLAIQVDCCNHWAWNLGSNKCNQVDNNDNETVKK